MSWSTFHCEDPDFLVRSIPDGDVFKVKRQYLEAGSHVFHDMFETCCESGYVIDLLDEDAKTLDLNESATALNLLFIFLHHTPEPYTEERQPKATRDFTRVQPTLPRESSIPFPLLPQFLRLADKYAFSDELQQCLHSHLGAYASTSPLRVYGYAVELGLKDVAAKASMFLLDPPLSSYSEEEVKAIPTAEAYHKLVLLHDFRIKKLGAVLMGEEIFPHGYGKCPRHAQKTQLLWEEKKKSVIPKIQAATDVAAEMAEIQVELKDCESCSRACEAAVSMLGYKCAKIPRRVDKIPV